MFTGFSAVTSLQKLLGRQDCHEQARVVSLSPRPNHAGMPRVLATLRTGKKTMYFCNNRENPGAGKMAQRAKKVSATKSEDLTLMPRDQKVEGRTSSYEQCPTHHKGTVAQTCFPARTHNIQ